MVYVRLFLIFQFVVLLIPIVSCEDDNESVIQIQDDEIVTIGIYSGNGAAEGCIIASEKMFQWMDYSTRRIIASDINNCRINDIDILYFPGGSSGPYLSEITNSGKDYLKQLVKARCGFIGTCAGALFACETQLWNGQTIINGQLGIFKGIGVGPNPEIFAYPEIGMCKINHEAEHPILKSLPDTSWIMFYNGPYFKVENPSNVFIIGKYDVTNNPALIACSYGKGKVFLTGPHLEWEEDSDRDGINYFKQFDDLGSDWDLMRNVVVWCLDKD